MTAKINGSVLSSLFFEHCNAVGDQEGFLLGQVVSHVSDVISDTQINNQKEERIIYIYGIMPCSKSFTWYDHRGRVVHSKLCSLLSDVKHKDIIGWYKFRRNSSMKLSYRETLIHLSLKEALPLVSQKDFLFGLFTASASNLSLHTYDHCFYTFNSKAFQPMAATIVNLGDTALSDYKYHSPNTVGPSCSTYNQTMSKYHREFLDKKGQMLQVRSIQKMNSCLQSELSNLCQELVKSENEVANVLQEVKLLRDKQRRKKVAIQKVTLTDKPLPKPPPALCDDDSLMDTSETERNDKQTKTMEVDSEVVQTKVSNSQSNMDLLKDLDFSSSLSSQPAVTQVDLDETQDLPEMLPAHSTLSASTDENVDNATVKVKGREMDKSDPKYSSLMSQNTLALTGKSSLGEPFSFVKDMMKVEITRVSPTKTTKSDGVKPVDVVSGVHTRLRTRPAPSLETKSTTAQKKSTRGSKQTEMLENRKDGQENKDQFGLSDSPRY